MDDEGEVLLRGMAERLDALARECVRTGEGPHLVGPLRALADGAWRWLYLQDEARGQQMKREA